MKVNIKERITSVDALRGFVMVIMVLDHVRDFLSNSSINVVNAAQSSGASNILLFTRLITNICAPTFILLVGVSMSLAKQNGKSNLDICKFLISRGLWMIFADFFIISTIWTFSIDLSLRNFQVFSAIGCAMIVLGLLIWLPKSVIFIFSLIIIFGHNLLDGQEQSILGSLNLLHVWQYKNFSLFGNEFTVKLRYPIIPWIAIPALGYALGNIFTIPRNHRLMILYISGISAVVIFLLLRVTNFYGDVIQWTPSTGLTKSLLEFFNCTKYPPSLQYLLYTLGIGLCLLAMFEQVDNSNIVKRVLLVYGQVPFMFYLMHLLIIHLVAIALMSINYGRVDLLFSNELIRLNPQYIGQYGYSLFVNYLIWIGIILSLYPICRLYGIFKAKYRSVRLLSYI